MAATNLLFAALAWSGKSEWLFAVAVLLDDIAAAFATVAFVAFSAALLGAAGAHAQSQPKGMDFTVRSEALPQGGKTLKWDMQNGRWGVTLDLDQPSGRDVQLNDVQAGAYFRVTPSLRVGGAVALGEKEEPAFKKTQPTESTPRVRLETALRF